MCFMNSKVIPEGVIDDLDRYWNLLGSETICDFVDQFLSFHPDYDIVFRSGPAAYLKGLISASQTMVSRSFESLSLFSAQLQLFSRTMASTKASVCEAEKTWKRQSSLISQYMAKAEVDSKALALLKKSTKD